MSGLHKIKSISILAAASIINSISSCIPNVAITEEPNRYKLLDTRESLSTKSKGKKGKTKIMLYLGSGTIWVDENK